MSSFLGGIGGADCRIDVPQQPTVTLIIDQLHSPTDTASVGALNSVCFLYFAKGKTIEWQISSPDGTSERRTFCYLCAPEDSDPVIFYDWQGWGSIPGDRVGSYRITASQGSLRVTTAFTLEHGGSPPLLRVLEHSVLGSKPVGTTIHVVLAGFESRRVVNLLIYHQASSNGEAGYITTMPVGTDVHGEKLYGLHTQSGDPKGCYVLRAQPAVNFRDLPYDATDTDTFCLR